MMGWRILFTAAIASVLISVGSASAASVFDLQSLTPGSYSSASQSVDGITATISNAEGFAVRDDTPSTMIISDGMQQPFVVNFSELVTNVSVFGGDFGSDLDGFYLEAYSALDATGTRLGRVESGPCCDGFSFNGATVALGATGVRSIAFFTTAAGPFPGSLFFDDITVNGAVSAVPEPASWAMLVIGFAAIGSVVRRTARSSLSHWHRS